MITVFTCADDFSAMLTCIYDAWSSGLGHENIRLEVEPVEQLSFLENYIHVEADDRKTNSVIDALCTKISPYFYYQLLYCLGAYEKDTLNTVYHVMILAFKLGPQVLDMYQYRDVSRFLEIKKRYANEAHSFLEFLRFNSVSGKVYVAHIEPKSHVVMSIAGYFADRLPSEYWIIIDDVHREAVVHPADQEYYLRFLSDDEYNKLKETEQIKDDYTYWWKGYFKNIAIKERKNYLCQMNHFPKWKRKHVTEFMN